MKNLYSPVTIKNISMRNRIVMPPMCMYSASSDGLATPWHVHHYQTRAQGGAGLIIQEATAVESRGRISSLDLGIWNDNQIPLLAEIVKGIKEEGSIPAIQLAHAGRKCIAGGEDVIAPSPINFDDRDSEYKSPREMTLDDMEDVIESFKNGALRASEAGYEILEIHGAHGYLISEFLSPLTNVRTDSFGGSKEKRSEFLKLIIRSVRSVWSKEKPLILRISAMDYGTGGNQAEDLAEIINMIKTEGIDAVHVSTGGVVANVTIPVGPAFQIPAAKIIKEMTRLPVIGGGMITDGSMAEDIIARGDTDMVFFGRELLRNPYFPLLNARDAGIDLDYWPKQYLRSK